MESVVFLLRRKKHSITRVFYLLIFFLETFLFQIELKLRCCYFRRKSFYLTSFVCQTGIIVLSSQEDKKFSLDKTKCENFHEGNFVEFFCGFFLGEKFGIKTMYKKNKHLFSFFLEMFWIFFSPSVKKKKKLHSVSDMQIFFPSWNSSCVKRWKKSLLTEKIICRWWK